MLRAPEWDREYTFNVCDELGEGRVAKAATLFEDGGVYVGFLWDTSTRKEPWRHSVVLMHFRPCATDPVQLECHYLWEEPAPCFPRVHSHLIFVKRDGRRRELRVLVATDPWDGREAFGIPVYPPGFVADSDDEEYAADCDNKEQREQSMAYRLVDLQKRLKTGSVSNRD